MGIVTRNELTENQENVNASDINGIDSDMATEFNGNIDNANIKATANIACTKTNGNFGAVNIVTTGNLTVGTNADIDGTLETDAITLNGASVNAANGLLKLNSNAGIISTYETTDASQVGGSTTALAEDTWYTTTCDGFVVCSFVDTSDNGGKLLIKIDESGGSTTSKTITCASSATSGVASGISFNLPIKSGYSWRLEYTPQAAVNTALIMFIPIIN